MKKIYKSDCIVIGAGIFGLYAALLLTKKGKKVIVLEKGQQAFSKASSINQARIHNGYHYPRSYKTAEKAACYYYQFTQQFDFAINRSFKQIYAIASNDSKTTTEEFINFCKSVNIPLTETDSSKFFKKDTVEAAFIAHEYSFDFEKIKTYLLENIQSNTTILYDVQIQTVEKNNDVYTVTFNNNTHCSAPLIINASYSGINTIIEKFQQESFDLKYELCEVAFCNVPVTLQNVGITIMDGDYFSIMPFGTTNKHTFTSVKHTPRYISYETISKDLSNSIGRAVCKMHNVRACIICSQQLKSAWPEMYKLFKVFIKPEFRLMYKYSQYEIKTILSEAEDDDARPTIIKKHTSSPTFISILSGKLSTIYDLDQYL